MHILTEKKWKEGFLDYRKNPGEYRIRVLAWKQLEKLENAYHTRPKSIRLLWNYLPVVGPEGLFTKTWSRLREEHRNKKYVSCGVGIILEKAHGGTFNEKEVVAFIAPFHPPLVERVTLPEEFVFKLEPSDMPDLQPENIAYVPPATSDVDMSKNAWWHTVRGWSVYSGIEVSQETRRELAEGLREEIKNTDWSGAQRFDISSPSAVREIKGEAGLRRANPSTTLGVSPSTKLGVKKTGVVFGFGNYAKINILPYTRPFVDINTVHEIDPTQIFFERNITKWDSAPFPRDNEQYDVYCVASYNHTHVPITLHALRQGAYALVEKPVVNDYEELDALQKALREAGRKVFIGFHKRYGIFNRMALKDLGVTHGEPVSYHSIVYELIQPEFFWYNWPVSRSTFFANGCHQIDHFLHLNNYSKPKDFDIKLLQDNAVEVWIELENGATFTTTFSEKGSSRVGPRDHVELKAHGRDVRITDNIRYMSEDNHRVIRKMRVFKTHSYKTMYQEIGKKIANNEEGDSIESILISSKIMLDLEERLQTMKGWGDRYEKAKKEFWSNFSPR